LITDLFFLIALSSDFADGYVARRLGVTSDVGAILDASVDFLFIGGMFLQFTLTNMYPPWVFPLTVFMFGQFAITSVLFKRVFDPLGKYYGSLLYGAMGLTILFPPGPADNIITTALLIVSITCLTSRIIYLGIKRNAP
jgi:CDP-diacylglycerol--glycerol-3-phosphate 3-phosphatidyltransferase/cardiolipin synthase